MLCPNCGFDSSRDYGKYPTFGAVGKAPTVSALGEQWRENPTPPKKKKPWLAIAVCAAIFALGIWIGTGINKPEPTEPELTSILRSDEIADDYDGTYEEYPVFGSAYQRGDIASVTFLDTMSDMPANAWDVSEDGNGKVMAWVKPNESLYDLYIGAEGGVWGGESCKELFAGYKNAERIVFADVFHTENVQDMSFLFLQCHDLTSLELSEFDTSNVQIMSYMFTECEKLSTLDLSSFDTANVESMLAMFLGCSSLSDLKVSRFDTSKVRSMYGMFAYCETLSTLDLSSFDTSNVTKMSDMFNGCMKLDNLILSDHFVTDNAITEGMFSLCPSEDKWGYLEH